VKANLLALGADPAVCDEIAAAWDAIADRMVNIRVRQVKMRELIGAVQKLKAPTEVKDEMWRLQKALTRYT
jgi:hypothetical protein